MKTIKSFALVVFSILGICLNGQNCEDFMFESTNWVDQYGGKLQTSFFKVKKVLTLNYFEDGLDMEYLSDNQDGVKLEFRFIANKKDSILVPLQGFSITHSGSVEMDQLGQLFYLINEFIKGKEPFQIAKKRSGLDIVYFEPNENKTNGTTDVFFKIGRRFENSFNHGNRLNGIFTLKNKVLQKLELNYSFHEMTSMFDIVREGIIRIHRE